MTEKINVSGLNMPNNSPMTEISLNLGSTSISQFCRKRQILNAENVVNVEKNINSNEPKMNSACCVKMNSTFIQNNAVFQDITNTVNHRLTSFHNEENSPEKCNTHFKKSLMDSPSRQDSEMSLYGGSSPSTFSPSCSPDLPRRVNVRAMKSRNTFRLKTRSYDDVLFSLDSGISSFQDNLVDENKMVNFIDPDTECYSNTSKHSVDVHSTINLKRKSLFRGLSDISNDEDLMDVLDIDLLEQNVALPLNFDNLVSSPILTDIKKKSNNKEHLNVCEKNVTLVKNNFHFERSKSEDLLNDSMEKNLSCHNMTPVVRKRVSCVKSHNGSMQIKRYKSTNTCTDEDNLYKPTYETPKSVAKFNLAIGSESTSPVSGFSSLVCSPDSIMSAVHRSTEEPDLIGDFSKSFVLPLISGSHQDLKSISADTVAKLLMGEYVNKVESFKIIDCRYPYEFDGGHIKGALNFYKKEQIESEFFNSKNKFLTRKSDDSNLVKRNIIIFHCEFSAQRAPKLFRFLREVDRTFNNTSYPALCYPEVYLLEGGYKNFFENFSELCTPKAYLPMADPAHSKEYRFYRMEKYSWSSQTKGRKMSVKRSALEF